MLKTVLYIITLSDSNRFPFIANLAIQLTLIKVGIHYLTLRQAAEILARQFVLNTARRKALIKTFQLCE